MFSIRHEGMPFKSGLNFQFGTWKVPYIALHWVSVNFNDDICKRWSLRFRLWSYRKAYTHVNGAGYVFPELSYPTKIKGPKVFWNYTSYNFIQSWLDARDAIAFRQTDYERYVEFRKGSEREIAREKRRLERIAEESRAKGPMKKFLGTKPAPLCWGPLDLALQEALGADSGRN